MVGLELPILAMEHQYIITDDLPELAGQPELLHVIDFEGEIYMRQERGGVLLGTYERAGVPWSPRTTPWDFGQDLLPNDLERIAPSLEVGFKHFPRLGEVGIRKIVNGPFTFAPDGNPLVGPVPGLRNFWVACGVMAGFSQGGGVGLALSHWMVDGDPGADIWAMDVARYGEWATRSYTNTKVRENYSRRFRIRFPNEELPAARPLKTTPIYEPLKAENPLWGDYCGLEHALWFAPQGSAAHEEVTFRRSNAHEHVGAECRAVRDAVGMIEISNYGKFEVTGRDAERWLGRVMANKVPAKGRVTLTPMLNERGKLIGDFTMCRINAERFLLIGTYAAERFYQRWFEARTAGFDVQVRACAMEWLGLALAGPASRDVLQTLVDEDLSTKAFPFMSFGAMDVGLVPALVGRLSFTGELGYEIWVKNEFQRELYMRLVAAGKTFGLRHFGGRALNSLRMEKSFGSWAREYRPIYGPYEAGLDRFVDLNKPEFVGREAAVAEKSQGGARKLITLEIDARDCDAIADEPIWLDGNVVGWVTSGAYGHASRKSLALGYVDAACAQATHGFEVELIGERRPALRLATPAVDPTGQRMRT
jgi:dimethylglycine dehydrogenase